MNDIHNCVPLVNAIYHLRFKFCWQYEYIYGGLHYIWLAMMARLFIGMFVQVLLVSTVIINLQFSNPSFMLGVMFQKHHI